MSYENAAVKLLLKQRKAVADAIALTPEGRELARLDAALAALGVDPTQAPKRNRQTSTNSVRSKVQRLLDRAPETWTNDSIISEYERLGDPIQGSDPKAALRTAIWAMRKDGDAILLAGGRLISAIHKHDQRFAPDAALAAITENT